MSLFDNPNSKSYARIAGAFYLMIAVAGGFSIAYVPSVLHVADNPAATLARIAENRGLFLAGIGSDVVMMLCEVVVTAMLYFMFRQVSATISLMAALARFAMVAVMAAMLFFQAGTLALADGELMADGFMGGAGDAVAGLLIYLHDAGVWIWQIFFCAHLLLLGLLVARSNQFPPLLGYALSLGGLGYFLDSVYAFAFPDLALLGQIRVGLLALVTLAEIGFALWLVFVGPSQPETKQMSTP